MKSMITHSQAVWIITHDIYQLQVILAPKRPQSHLSINVPFCTDVEDASESSDDSSSFDDVDGSLLAISVNSLSSILHKTTVLALRRRQKVSTQHTHLCTQSDELVSNVKYQQHRQQQ